MKKLPAPNRGSLRLSRPFKVSLINFIRIRLFCISEKKQHEYTFYDNFMLFIKLWIDKID